MPFSDFLKSLLGGNTQASGGAKTAGVSGHAKVLPDSPDEPAQITNPKVLLLIYNPTMDAASGKKMVEYMNWSRPDALVGSFVSDVLQASNGLARYQIVQRVELDEFPALIDGYCYTPQTYLDTYRGTTPAHNPAGIDYAAILQKFNILQLITNNVIDEVWVMGFPYAGLYESVMGGAGAFWCNAAQLANTETCKRRFVIMGFNYERQVGEMLHSYDHRCEAIMAQIFNSQDFLQWAYRPNRAPSTLDPAQTPNLFQRFILFDQIAPGKAAMGSVHYAPNAVKDYDLGNPNQVQSECYDWLKFPNFQGDVRMVSATEWGGGDERAYQQWWLRHLPRAAGRKNGIHNNWWQYIANPNNVVV